MKVSDKLMKYIVEITETLQKQLIVELDERNLDNAYDTIREAYRSAEDDQFILNEDDLVSQEIVIKEADEDSAADVSLQDVRT